MLVIVNLGSGLIKSTILQWLRCKLPGRMYVRTCHIVLPVFQSSKYVFDYMPLFVNGFAVSEIAEVAVCSIFEGQGGNWLCWWDIWFAMEKMLALCLRG